MPYASRELFGRWDQGPFGRFGPEAVIPCSFAADVAETELLVGTPVAYDEAQSAYVPWSAAGTGGADEIVGFVYPDAFRLDGTDWVLAQVMVKGRLHYDDIVLPVGESVADLQEALRTQCLRRGLIVRGLTDVR